MEKDRDCYRTLGVARSASQDEIKRAYRKLAKKHHPDRNPGDPTAETRFKEVQQAYEILSDTERRTQYDQFGEAGVGRWNTNPHGEKVYQWGGRSAVSIDDLDDLMAAFGGGRHANIFDELFGARGHGRESRPAPRRGGDEEHSISLTFEQAARGCTVDVKLTNAQAGRSEVLDVKVPAGVEDGQRIRIKGRGRPGVDRAPPGDLFLCCSVTPHPYFTRRGADIYVDVPVTVAEATLGAKIEVPSLDGRTIVALPPGTPSGAKLRLKDHGVAKRDRSGRGDQYVVIKIVPPTKLTDEQRRAFQNLLEYDESDLRSKCSWWGG